MQSLLYESCDQTFLFSHEKRTGAMTMPSNHFHDAYELYYMAEGRRNYFVRDRILAVQKGDLVLIRRHDLHRTTDAGAPAYERYLVNFRPEALATAPERRQRLLRPFEQDIMLLRLSMPERLAAEQLLHRMAREVRERPFAFEEMMLACLGELLVLCSRNCIAVRSAAPGDPMRQRVADMAQYINAHYGQELTLASVAGHFHISPYYFCRVFRTYTGFTFVEYLNNLRVREACRLLRESPITVLQISQQVGYGSVSHFGRVFKQLMGVSPVQYRRSARR